MLRHAPDDCIYLPELGSASTAEQVVEFAMLLPASQMSLLEEVGRVRGLTVGQLLRRLIHIHCEVMAQGLVGDNPS